MKLTKENLVSYRACPKGLAWYEASGCPETVEETISLLLASGEQEILSWSNWLLSKVLSRDGKFRYALFAARDVLSDFEDKYPNDARPRNAIDAAEKFLTDPTDENKLVAELAAELAGSAEYAAEFVEWSVDSAAYAAWAATWSAEDKETILEIIDYGLLLIKEAAPQ